MMYFSYQKTGSYTPGKTNMSSKKGPFLKRKGKRLPTSIFQRRCDFGGELKSAKIQRVGVEVLKKTIQQHFQAPFL